MYILKTVLCPASSLWPMGKRDQAATCFPIQELYFLWRCCFPFCKRGMGQCCCFSAATVYTAWEQIMAPSEAASYHSRL